MTSRKICLRRCTAAARVQTVEYRQRILTKATLNNSNVQNIIIIINTDIVRTGDLLGRFIEDARGERPF